MGNCAPNTTANLDTSEVRFVDQQGLLAGGKVSAMHGWGSLAVCVDNQGTVKIM